MVNPNQRKLNDLLSDYQAKYSNSFVSRDSCGGLNNKISRATNPMPQKFGVSDGTQTFSANRNAYNQSVDKNYNRTLYCNPTAANSRQGDKNILSGPKSYNKKGIPCTSNTSSTVTEMRRIRAIGRQKTKYGLEKNAPFSFSSNPDENFKSHSTDANAARRRSRSSGYTTPKVVTGRRDLRPSCSSSSSCHYQIKPEPEPAQL